MSFYVLTTDSTVKCGPAPPGNPPPVHGGTVAVSGSTKLTVKSKGVLLLDGILNKAVNSCNTPVPPATNLKCVTVNAAGTPSTKLTVNGAGVMKDNVTGTTPGHIGPAFGVIQATAVGHNKLSVSG